MKRVVKAINNKTKVVHTVEIYRMFVWFIEYEMKLDIEVFNAKFTIID